MASSFGEDDVTIRFVISSNKKTEDLCSNDVKQAFQVCLDHNLLPLWISEEECLDFEPRKTDVFVFEEFSGRAFGFLKSFRCIIIGPRCILDCVATNSLIPKGDHPLFTVAMQNLIITTTGFTEPLKSQIIEKIQWMGGVYCPEYRQSVTHLVACHLGSAKYEKAVETNLPVMSEYWVDAVWEQSCRRNVSATDEEFQCFKCPIFHRMVITCSQLPRKEKDMIKTLINGNGGEFHGELEAGRTKVLVVPKPNGDKYRHAILWHIPCVKPTWVVESVSHGHALPTASFSLDSLSAEHKTSTPQRQSNTANALNFSASIIQPNYNNVNETMDCTTASVASVKPIESPKKDKHLMMIKKINMLEVKKAGQFLDGCNVYLSGFNVENTDKLRKIINSGGATRFNEISDSVTHVIVGDFVAADVKIMKEQGGTRLHVVTVEWLVESIRLRSPAPEDAFSCLGDLPSPVDFASPLSKKGLLVLKTPGSVGGAASRGAGHAHVRALEMASPQKDATSSLPRDLLEQYSQQERSSPTLDHNSTIVTRNGDDTHFEKTVQKNAETSNVMIGNAAVNNRSQSCKPNETEDSGMTEDATTQLDFFAGLTFSISGYNAVNTQELVNLITSAGGRVVTRRFKGVPDYSVMPLRGVNPNLHNSAKEVVTHLWLEECADEHSLLPVQYYHRPLDFAEDVQPLSECVITATLYSGIELRFISELLLGLGAVHQAMMARVDRPADGIRATTHLIAPERAQDLLSSRKYKAACKWGVPCVTHQWVLTCARTGRRQPENDFLVAPDVVDASVVEKTPIAPATKRKLGEDTHLSKFEIPVSTTLASVPGVTPTRASHLNMEKFRTPSIRSMSPQNAGSPVARSGTPLGANVTPETPWATPRGPHDIPTPDTPYGQVFVDNPSPKTRKMWKRWIDTWPEEPPGPPPRALKRRNSTPLAELKRRIWHKFAIEPYEKSFGVKVNGQTSGDDVDADMAATLHEEELARVETQVEEGDSPPGRSSPSFNHSLETRQAQIRLSPEAMTKGSVPHVALADSIRRVLSPASTPLQVAPQGAGINTQLQELDHIMDSVSRSGGSGEASGGVCAMTGAVTPRAAHIPSHADVLMPGSELVEWVDPVVNQQQKPTPVFLLTSIEEREKYEAIVRELQGVMSSAMYMESSVTHLVCESATRNEKILSSIASGKWVLEKRFLDDSQRVGRFLDEEDYEWGNPRAKYLAALLKPGSIGAQLADAVYRWRRKVQATGRGAFAGMRAIVGAGNDKAELYKRLIIAGSGQVLNISPPFSDPENATVCILELNKVSYPVDLRSLAKNGVPCVLPIYLNNFLINDPPPDINDCLIPQYKKLLNSE